MCEILTKHHILYFLAGAAAFHAFGHFMLYFTDLLPLTLWGFTLTSQLNAVSIILSLIVAVGLIYYASMTKCEHHEM